MRATTLATIVLAAAGAIALAGCSATPGSDTPTEVPEPSSTPEARPVFSASAGTAATPDPFLTFKDDGTFNGSDGCNDLAGTYTRDADVLTLDLGLTTLKGCPGVDTWLRGVHTVKVADPQVAVFDKNGAEIGALTVDAS